MSAAPLRETALSVTGLLTLRQAAKALGMNGESQATRLRRMFLRREREIGCQIMKRGEGPKRPKLFVTMTLVYDHFPELFSARDELVELIRGQVTEFTDSLDTLQYQNGVLCQQVRNMKQRIAKLEAAVKLLTKHIGEPMLASKPTRASKPGRR